MQALREYLAGIKPGPVLDVERLEELIASAWDEFTSDEGGMKAEKLSGRMEGAQWNPPWLTLQIERHGGMKLGSTRAELQLWSLNTETAVARFTIGGHRQLRPRKPPLNVQPIADEIASLIAQERPDPRLKRNADGSVRVLIGQVLPNNGAKQTVEARRQRFKERLHERLVSRGWMQATGKDSYTFVRARR